MMKRTFLRTLFLFTYVLSLTAIKYTDERQDIHNIFGDTLGSGNILVHEFLDISSSGLTEDTIAETSLFKQVRRYNFNMFYGLVLFQENLVYDLSYQVAIQEMNRKNHFSSYLLSHNQIDGMFATFKHEKYFQLDMLLSYLTADPVDTHNEKNYSEDPILLEGLESDLTYGLRLNLDFLSRIESPYVRFRDVQIAFVNTVYQDKGASSDLLRGNAPLFDPEANITNITKSINVKISSYPSSSGSNFAAFYGAYVEVDGARTIIDLLDISGIDTSLIAYDAKGRRYLKVPEGKPFKFTLAPPVTETKKSIKVGLILANSFYIQHYHEAEDAETFSDPQLTLPEDVVVYSESQNIRDFSNFDDYTFFFGVPTANNLFGIEGKANIFGFDCAFGVFANIRYAQTPVYDGAYSKQTSLAYYLDVTKAVGPLIFRVETFHMAPDYQTRFTSIHRSGTRTTYYTVLDNEDNDFETPFFLDYLEREETYEGGAQSDDLNNNSVPDYQEDFMLFRMFPAQFYAGDDFNNNGIIDGKEDDNLADYRYRENLQGVRSMVDYDILPFLRASIYVTYEALASSPDVSSFFIEPKIHFRLKEKKRYDVSATVYYKRAFDSIHNDVSEATFPDDTSRAYDTLEYTNSHVVYGNAQASLYVWDDMLVKTVQTAEYNIQEQANNTPNSILSMGNLFLFDYTLPVYLIHENLSINLVGMAQNVTEEFLPENTSSANHTRILALMGRATYMLSRNTMFNMGYQYLNRINRYHPGNDLIKNSFVFEFQSQAKIRRHTMNLLVGILLENYDYLTEGGGNLDTHNNTIYLRVAGDL